MSTQIEAIIQHEIKRDGRNCYYVVPSPVLGMTAKCGNLITNASDDPIWNDIIANCYTYPTDAEHRVSVVVAEDSPGGYGEVTVLSVERIED